MSVLNIGSRSTDWRARILSNFSAHSFMLDGEAFASVEGFIQGIKFPERAPMRKLAFASVGIKAKRLGRKAREFVLQSVYGDRWLRWREKSIPFRSKEHHQLIEKAIRAKFEQNPDAMKALLATAGMELTHDLGHPESSHTSLPAAVFCDILTRIREEKLKANRG